MQTKNYICVSFDGVDCSGKSTAIQTLTTKFQQLGYVTKVFKDFTDNETLTNKKSSVNEIRKYVLESDLYNQVPNDFNTLLISAARLKMIADINKFVQSNINEKPVIILLDRYVQSTLAYQINMGSNINLITYLCEYACSLLKPDLSIFLDISYDIYLNRLNNRGGIDVIESTLNSKFKIIRNTFICNFLIAESRYADDYVSLDNNSFNNGLVLEDLIKAVLLSYEYNKTFQIKI